MENEKAKQQSSCSPLTSDDLLDAAVADIAERKCSECRHVHIGENFCGARRKFVDGKYQIIVCHCLISK